MTGERIARAALAAFLGEVLLSVGQVSADLPVFALQVISSAALAGLLTCQLRCRAAELAGRRADAGALPGAGRGTQ
jgi:hypothetical protein